MLVRGRRALLLVKGDDGARVFRRERRGVRAEARALALDELDDLVLKVLERRHDLIERV
jgi:hypothetical protein